MLGHQPSFRHFLYTAVANIATLIFVVIGTILIVALAQGYRYDVASGEVSLSGLLRVESRPVTAEVFIDGQSTDERTSYKETIPEGSYNVELVADGYRTWQKDVQIRGGLVEWLRYPRLIPETLVAESVLAQPATQELSFSPDGQFAVRGTAQELALLDLTNPSAQQQPINLTVGPDSSIQSILWNSNGSAALIVIAGEQPSFVIFEPESLKVTDVTKVLSSFTPVALLEDQIIGRRGANDLWAVPINGETVSPLAASATAFSTSQNYTVWVEDGVISLWDGEQIVAIEDVIRYPRLIPETLVAESVLAQPATQELSFSPDGQFAVRGTAQELALLDLTNPSAQQQPINLTVGPDSSIQSILWNSNGSAALIVIAGEQPSFVIFEPESLKVTDVTKVLSSFTPVALLEDQIIGRRGANDLWAVPINGETVSPLAASATAFSTSQNYTVWVEDGVISLWDGEQIVAIEDVIEATPTEIDIFEFESKQYIAGMTDEGGFIIRDVLGKQSVRDLPAATDYIEASRNGHYALFETTTGYNTVDLDQNTVHQFTFDQEAANIRWADDFSLLAEVGEAHVLLEFDGGNQEVVTTALDASDVVLSQSGRSAYVVSEIAGSNSTVLDQISLIVQDN
ncbi:TPA: PEGA domain-containing protein [Candidatus Saccharibacteria bacterium]|nr:PEGA domain-containing protein [Candidatus Saccharibacteria bacterium]